MSKNRLSDPDTPRSLAGGVTPASLRCAAGPRPCGPKELGETLKAEILERFASVHAFCKAHPELARGTVYQTLSGRYAGSFENQAKKIRAALENPDKKPQIKEDFQIDADVLGEELQAIRCQNCRRLNRRDCMACRDQTIREAAELHKRVYCKRERC